MDSYVDMFNILSAVASRYVDAEGTFVRKLSLDNYPFQLRASVGIYDPVVVLVDAEIEQAIGTMAGDLTSLKRASHLIRIDWVKFQYCLSLIQAQAPSGWTAPGFRRGGRYPVSVQNICQNLIQHDAFNKCHTTLIKEWHKVRHMLTLKRDAETSQRYSHEAIKALCEYNTVAVSNAADFETEALHEIFDNEEKWLPMVNDTLEIMRHSSNIGNLPTGQLGELERESRRAEDELLQGEQDALDAAERRKQKKDKKDKRSHSVHASRPPTVIILPCNAPHESESEEEDTTGVERQLDFDGCASSDVEVKSSPKSVKTLDPKEPQTPEEVIARTTEPPTHGVQDVQLIPEATVEGTDQGNAPGEVDAHHAPEQEQSTGEVRQPEEESQNPPQDGDKPDGEEDKNPDKEHDGNLLILLIHLILPKILTVQIKVLMRKMMGRKMGEEGEEGEQQGAGEEEEREEDEQLEVVVESESTKKKKKEEERERRLGMPLLPNSYMYFLTRDLLLPLNQGTNLKRALNGLQKEDPFPRLRTPHQLITRIIEPLKIFVPTRSVPSFLCKSTLSIVRRELWKEIPRQLHCGVLEGNILPVKLR